MDYLHEAKLEWHHSKKDVPPRVILNFTRRVVTHCAGAYMPSTSLKGSATDTCGINANVLGDAAGRTDKTAGPATCHTLPRVTCCRRVEGQARRGWKSGKLCSMVMD